MPSILDQDLESIESDWSFDWQPKEMLTYVALILSANTKNEKTKNEHITTEDRVEAYLKFKESIEQNKFDEWFAKFSELSKQYSVPELDADDIADVIVDVFGLEKLQDILQTIFKLTLDPNQSQKITKQARFSGIVSFNFRGYHKLPIEREANIDLYTSKEEFKSLPAVQLENTELLKDTRLDPNPEAKARLEAKETEHASIWIDTNIFAILLKSLPVTTKHVFLSNNRLDEHSAADLIMLLNSTPDWVKFVGLRGNNFSNKADVLIEVFKNLNWQTRTLAFERKDLPAEDDVLNEVFCALPPRVRVQIKGRVEKPLQVAARDWIYVALKKAHPDDKISDDAIRSLLHDDAALKMILDGSAAHLSGAIISCFLAQLTGRSKCTEYKPRTRLGI